MTVAVVSALMLHPDWSALGQGMLPRMSPGNGRETLRYWYFAVGIFSAMLMEYEVHFYSSGALEEDWKENDLSENFMVASFGSVLGAVLTIALLVIGALVFFPRHVFPETLPAALAGIATPFAKTGRVAVLLGALACLAGAAVETMLSAGYNLGQFYDFPWGKNRKMREVPLFTASWLGALAVATILALTPVQPLQLVNISVIFGMVVMPLTYFPILRVAMDRGIMGRHANARTYNVIGIIFLLLITVAALAAIPLMLATDSGRP